MTRRRYLARPPRTYNPHRGYEPDRLQRDEVASALACEQRTVSGLLAGRLREQELDEAARRARADGLELPPDDERDPTVRLPILLSYGMWFGIPGVAEKTRLPVSQPPDEIHAMARGPLAAAGGIYEADMVADALRGAGVDIGAVSAGLDFGCSSGRLVRVLAAAYPDVRWLGCDPNEAAIDWARDNLAGIEFFVSGSEPPLPLDPASVDLICAISVWSHFEPTLGARWLDEMHRILRPGGHIVFTTHGLTAVAHAVAHRLRPVAQADEIARALYRRGWWYAAEFGERGDWGVVNPSWGTAFVSPEWMLATLCPRWSVVEFAPGRNQSNQDIYVVERR